MSIEVRAQNTLSMTSVKAIKDATDQSAELLATMEQYAEDAGTTLTGIYQDAKDAQDSADRAQASADSASEYASRAFGNLSTVQSITETLAWITQHGTMALTTDTAIDPTHVYFVVDANGDYVVNNTHYAIVIEPDVADLSTYYELTIDESLNNYVGTHLALTSEGLWLLPASSGTNKVLIATGAGSTYATAGTYIIDGNNTALASFTANGATVGKENGAHTRVDANGMRVFSRNGTLVLADIGYGTGTSPSGTTQDAPYYTLGHRPSNSTIGNYSVAEGSYTTASGYGSHAEGSFTTASGGYSHAEGSYTTASGAFAHAEGLQTTASGAHSHAEGNETTASGWHSHAEGSYTTASGGTAHAEGENTVAEGLYSHAGGNYTIANAKSQTVIGEYNEADTTSHAGLRGTYALIIGNGRADDARSNAFAVDWNGDIYPQATKMADFIVDQGTDGMWTYRKWSSGIAECWGCQDIPSTTYSANGGYKAISAGLPSGLFITTPNIVIASGRIDTLIQTDIGFTSPNDASTIQTYLINRSGSAVTKAGKVYWNVKGKWK